jgi:hypothetical protein
MVTVGRESQMSEHVWDYRETTWSERDEVVGYEVIATDGSIGKIAEATTDTGAAHIVVDTGPWIFGKKRLLPAGTVIAIDDDAQTVTVSLSKDQVKAGPDYDEDSEMDDEKRLKHSDHYGPFSW